MTLDVLHHIVMHPVVLAHAVDWHNPGMMESSRRPSLELEALHLGRVDPPVQGKDLQGDSPAQRLLQGLVHDPHATSTDLAEDAVFAEPIEMRGSRLQAALFDGVGPVNRTRLEALHDLQGREDLEDLLGPLWE